LIARTEREGRKALKRIEDLYETEEPSRLFPRAPAVARQGDWLQLYRSGSARRYYKWAYQLLEQMEDSEQYIARAFGEPRVLLAMASAQAVKRAVSPADPLRPEGEIIELEFDVLASGQPHDIRDRRFRLTLQKKPDDCGAKSRLGASARACQTASQ